MSLPCSLRPWRSQLGSAVFDMFCQTMYHGIGAEASYVSNIALDVVAISVSCGVVVIVCFPTLAVISTVRAYNGNKPIRFCTLTLASFPHPCVSIVVC